VEDHNEDRNIEPRHYRPTRRRQQCHPDTTRKRRALMSALHPKADMCGAKRDVRFVPKATFVATDQIFDDTADIML